MKSARNRKVAGKPPKYETPEELQEKINEYFEIGVPVKEVVITNKKSIKISIPTICGLVLYLGFCDRSSFYDLEKIAAFAYTIKKARLRMEQVYEELLHSGIPTGAIFALKNFNWKDKTDIEHSLSESTIDKLADKSVAELKERANALINGTPRININ